VDVNVSGDNIIGLGTQLNGYTDSALKFVVNLNSTGYYFKTAELPNTITFNCNNGNRAFFAYYNSIPAAGVLAEVADKTSNVLPRTINVDKSYKYIHIQISYDQATTNDQVCVGNTLKPYEPYNPNSEAITIQLGDTYYGCKLDVVSGVLTVDRACVDLGTLNWSYTSSSGRSLFTSNDITDYKHTGANDIPVNAICECFVIVPMSSIFVNGQMGMDGDVAKNRTIICDNRYSSASDFKTAMNGVQLVYELATPITIQLTPTAVSSLLGQNNIWADTGDVLDGQYFKSL
jgi:hypothetical protein